MDATTRSAVDGLGDSLPPEFDPAIYRGLHPDLKHMSDGELRRHCDRHGRNEGRRSHALADRKSFVARVPSTVDAMEIGPFHKPLLSGDRVRYFDVLDRDALIARAQRIGYPIDRVPNIDFVSPTGDLAVVEGTFDVVLSSHVIEHQPDVIQHLRAVERLLRPGGLYFLLVPNKAYCFDHFIPESTIAGMIAAHHARRRIHTLQSRIEHAALTTHNRSDRHWAGDHGEPANVCARIQAAVDQYTRDPDAYVDVHAWYFSPESFRVSIQLLHELKYIGLQVSRLYPTLKGSNEFWVVLRADGSESPVVR